MGIATQPSQLTFAYLSPPPKTLGGTQAGPSSPASMSRGFHQGIFSFPDGFDRSANREQHQNHHVAQQSRRDKLRVQGFDAAGHPLVPIDEHEEEASIYGSTAVGAGSMLSDMFSFPAAGLTAVDLHANQISGGFHLPPRPAAMAGVFTGDCRRRHSSSSIRILHLRLHQLTNKPSNPLETLPLAGEWQKAKDSRCRSLHPCNSWRWPKRTS
ncbi:hypothetical protein OPV22_033594 [Ensete ventricosum]|uniref:Uncharacterized protein n=1 Tax=Ensete ventricosum TaxID=4639 RepID=A0AAV8Q1T5_ENSVE|nr:hypothetical protein OPV22_033594 [Ensete ventricosum]